MKRTKALFGILTGIFGRLSGAAIICTCLILTFAGCGKSASEKPSGSSTEKTLVPKNSPDAQQEGKSSATSLSPEQSEMLGFAQQMLRYAATPDSIHILNVPSKPQSFAIKGQATDTYCSLLAQAKKQNNMQAILALIAFSKTNLQSQIAPTDFPSDYGQVTQPLVDLLQAEYHITIKPSNRS